MKGSVTCFVFTLWALTACVPRVSSGLDASHMKAQIASNPTTAQKIQEQVTVLDKKSAYVDLKKVPLSHAPHWLQNKIELHGKQLPFKLYVDHLLKGHDVRVQYGKDVDALKPIHFSFKGTVEKALNRLAKKTRYHYALHDEVLSWSRYAVKTFEIATFRNTLSEKGAVAPSQKALWKDLKKALRFLVSKKGKTIFSPSTATIVVMDRPENLEKVTHYIQAFNQNISKQVWVQLKTVTVTGTSLSDEEVFKLKNDEARARWIQGLKQKGRVQIETYPQVMTFNHQIAEMGLQLPEEGHWRLQLLPSVQKNKVFLQLNSAWARASHKTAFHWHFSKQATESKQYFKQSILLSHGETWVVPGSSIVSGKVRETVYLWVTPRVIEGMA